MTSLPWSPRAAGEPSSLTFASDSFPGGREFQRPHSARPSSAYPELDAIRVQDVDDLYDAPVPALLAWAAKRQRVVLTHDIATLAHYAYERIAAGLPMPGVFEISTDLSIGRAVEDLVLISLASEPGEWAGQVRFLPL